jgi:uncharacterized protein
VAVKTFPACVKATEPGDSSVPSGQFEAIVSVFNNIDHVGDVVRPGAFANTLAEWAKSGSPIPVLWSHRMDDPAFNIGAVTEAAEVMPGDARLPDWAPEPVKANGGLWIKALLDTGADASPAAGQTHRLLKEGRVRQFSFAYDVIDGGMETVDGQDAYALRELKLYEASVTQVGANDATTLLGVKDTAAAGGRTLTAANQTTIRKALALLGEALGGLGEHHQDDQHDQDDANTAEAKDEEPNAAKSEVPTAADDARLLTDLDIAEVALLL